MQHLHDHLFKTIMQQPAEARRCLEHFVDPATTAALNLDSLTLESDSLLDEELEEYFSDVVYSCNLTDKQTAKVCFLFEHKSYPDKKVLLQVLLYKALHYRKHLTKRPLELVIPIIFVHGKRDFKLHSLPDLFKLPNKHLEKFIPQFACELIDANRIDPKMLQGIHATYLYSLMVAFGSRGDKNLLLTNIEELFKFVDVQGDEHLRRSMFKAFLIYIFHAYRLETKDMIVVKKNIPQRVEKDFISTAQRLHMEGKMEGMTEGLIIGQQKQVVKKNLEFIANLIVDTPELTDKVRAMLAGVEMTFVQRVRTTFKQQELEKRKKSFADFYQKIKKLSKADQQEFEELFEKLDKKFNPPPPRPKEA